MLREIRERNGYTQQKLSELSKVKQQTISKIETNKCNLRIDIMYKLADAMGCSIEDLYKPDEKVS